MGTSTPWGKADHSKKVAPGIMWYGTPSHGGFHLSARKVAEMPPALREFKTFAGPGWYEEDCDWAVVVVAFPKFFSDEEVVAAKGTMARWNPDVWAKMNGAAEVKGA